VRTTAGTQFAGFVPRTHQKQPGCGSSMLTMGCGRFAIGMRQIGQRVNQCKASRSWTTLTSQSTRYTLPPQSLYAHTTFRPNFLRTIPEIAPRTVSFASRWPASIAGWSNPTGGVAPPSARQAWCRVALGCPPEVGDRWWCPTTGQHPAARGRG
jgi:hypothetical protein